MSFDPILRHISRHIQLTADEQDYFTAILKSKKVRRKQYVVQQGDVCRYENYVVSGSLRAYFADVSGFEHVVQFAVEDWWISDLASFITQTPASLNVDALENCELLQIHKADMEELYRHVPKFERFFRIMMQNAFAAQQQRILSNLSLAAEGRYLQFISSYPTFEMRFPQTQIASYLGITPEFLSKIRRQIRTSRLGS